MTTLLIDGDILAVRNGYATQDTFDWGDTGGKQTTADFDRLIEACEEAIVKWKKLLKADDHVICLSGANNFRKIVLPSYKAHRSGEKPVFDQEIREYLREHHPVKERDTLEADDVMGILATHPTLVPGKKIIVSQDKDMQTIPGRLFRPQTNEKLIITELQADTYWMFQTLTGDQVDGYKGCPSVGKVKATAILAGLSSLADLWAKTSEAFVERGCSIEDALTQARVARILRSTDYNFKTKEVKLWTPTNHAS